MKAGLTRRQWELLEFIRSYTAEHGYSPSFDEMKKHVGLASKSGIHRMVLALEERGYIKRPYGRRSRSIMVEGVTFDIPNDILIQLRKVASALKTTVSDVIESSLRQRFDVPLVSPCSISRETHTAAGADAAVQAPAAPTHHALGESAQ